MLLGLAAGAAPAQDVPAPQWLDTQAPAEARTPAAARPDVAQARELPAASARRVDAEPEPGTGSGAALPPVVLGSVENPAALTPARLQGLYPELAAIEPEYAGDPDFDAIYGLAALASEAHGEAVFALQRATLARPAALDLRFDLARAYYASGDYEAADAEFAALQAADPPPRLATVIRDYRQGIARNNARYRAQNRLWLAASAGHDSNANAATDLTDFNGFVLADAAREQESPYYGLRAQAAWSRPLTARWRASLEPHAAAREYPDFEAASRLELGLGAQAVYERAAWQGRLGPRYTQLWLDGEDNAQLLAMEGALSRSLGRSLLGVSARAGALRYPDELTVRDIDQYVLGLDAAYAVSGLPLQWRGGVLLGREEAVEEGSPNSRDTLGVQAGLRWATTPLSTLRAGVAWLDGSYDDPFFGESRDDTQLSANLALDLGLAAAPQWLFVLQGQWLDNDSSIDVFSYDRLELGLVAQWSFE